MSSGIIAPSYHVQSTARNLHHGFPCFTHHDSVSALWWQKWRQPCAAGIYPFTDAQVTDFDPVFAELAKISGDDPGILYRPDDYAKPFSRSQASSSPTRKKRSRSKTLARGISTGGYYALRIAHTHASRLFAVVAQGGGCHHMFDPEWIRAQNQMEYPFALSDALAVPASP